MEHVRVFPEFSPTLTCYFRQLPKLEDKRTFSKRQLKSTCTTSPVLVSSRMFSQCLSPSLCEEENLSSDCGERRADRIPKDESDHRHDGSCSPIRKPACKPRCRLWKSFNEPVMKYWWESKGTYRCMQIVALDNCTYSGSIFEINIWPASLSLESLIFLKTSAISLDYDLCQMRIWCFAKDTDPAFYTSRIIAFEKNRTDRDGVGHPLNETTFFVKSYYTIGANILRAESKHFPKNPTKSYEAGVDAIRSLL